MNSLPEWQFPLDETKKAQSLSVICQAAAHKRIRHYPTLAEHMWNQMRFHPPSHWFIKGGLLLAAMLLALLLDHKNIQGARRLAFCSVFFVFAGNICLSQVARLFSWHMAELEQTLYLNLKQMICLGMLEAGMADILFLSIFLIVAHGENAAGLSVSLVYMLAPFLWSDILYLHLLTCLRSSTAGFPVFIAGLLCGILALFPVFWESAYRPEFLIVWQLLTVAGILLLAVKIIDLLKNIERGDTICLN